MFNEVINELQLEGQIINTIQERLFTTGRTSSGMFLKTDSSKKGKVYAEKTIKYKKLTNLPSDHVTLYNSGEFYNSFEVEFKKKSIDISAEFKKDNNKISENFTYKFTDERFTKEILSLSNKEKKELGLIIVEKLVSKIINTLKNG